MIRHPLILGSALGTILTLTAQSAAAEPLRLGAAELNTRQLLVFQSGQTLFNETYRLPQQLDAGRIEIGSISPQLTPGSALLEGAGDIGSLALIYPQGDLQQRLQPLIGQVIELRRDAPGSGEHYRREARLLGIEGGMLLLQQDDKTEYLPLGGEWRPLLPGSAVVRARPYLQLLRSGPHRPELQLSYMAGGLNWQADYALTLAPAKSTLTLQAQATLSNHSGIDLPASRVGLLAGTVNQPQNARPYLAKAMMDAVAESLPTEQAFEDYHLYKLPNRVDLPSGASVSVPLLPVTTLKYASRYRFSQPVYGNSQPEPVAARPLRMISFTLPLQQAQKTALPAGNARVYIEDKENGRGYIGGQNIAAHAAGETVELTLGEAFDLRVEQVQTHYERLGNTTRVAYRLNVSNAGTEAREVELAASFNQNWTLTQASHAPQITGNLAVWKLQVPAEGSGTLEYGVELIRR